MEIDIKTYLAHRHAVATTLWALEQANPTVDFTAHHAALKAADTDAVTASGGTIQPLDGGNKPPQN